VHRTDSIDYAVVLSGEIDMELEKGEEVHLKAGDVLVQRGTVHNWVNRSKAPCVIAFVLVDAKPATAGGKVLNAFG
jgi:quercetin dioxygenase-like cupin family protein